jgi:hypothetical protein
MYGGSGGDDGVSFDLGGGGGGAARSLTPTFGGNGPFGGGAPGGVPGGLQRRASAPARGVFGGVSGAGSGSSGNASGNDDGIARGLPIHFLKHSGKAKPSKKERVLCASTFLAAAGLLLAGWVVYMLLRANRTQSAHLQAHHKGWKARLFACALLRATRLADVACARAGDVRRAAGEARPTGKVRARARACVRRR